MPMALQKISYLRHGLLGRTVGQRAPARHVTKDKREVYRSPLGEASERPIVTAIADPRLDYCIGLHYRITDNSVLAT
jgi:hypothetical protein